MTRTIAILVANRSLNSSCRGPLLARLTRIKSPHLAPGNGILENKSKAQFDLGFAWLGLDQFTMACETRFFISLR
jgi:hypothetical protein